jgi:hypothetical protein
VTEVGRPKRLTKSAAKKRLVQEWQQTLETCFGLTPGQINRLADGNFLRDVKDTGDLTDRNANEHNLKIGLAFALGKIAKIQTSQADITTEQQLEAALRQIGEVKEKMPTAIRKALKDLTKGLPRRGGPGRQPKLNAKEASQMCDQIALFIRRKHNLKEALRLASELSPSILTGKKVSPRTLQKAWDRRGEFEGE